MKRTVVYLITFIFIVTELACGQLIKHTVDYSRVVEWQRRTLYCAASADGVHSGACYLTHGKTEENAPLSARCREEHYFDEKRGSMERRSICNIECRKADRDSVISKVPNSNRQCIRYHTYNTQPTIENEWYLWRAGDCRLVEISLEVHCGFL